MRILFLIGAGLLASLLLSCKPSASPWTAGPDAGLAPAVDQYFRDIEHFSGNVLIARRGEILFSRSYGLANREFAVANQAETKFNIGSLTKSFTALAVLKLVEAGQLSLSDTLGQFLSQAPAHWQALSIHQLLSHTSGLIHSWDLLEDSTLMFQRADLLTTLSWYHHAPLLFEPGTDFSYSGVGYLALAAIIEQLSGQDYNQHLKEVIFEPLGMNCSGPSDPERLIPQLASGYRLDSLGLHPAPRFYLPLLTGGGNLYATVTDLLKWDRALASYRLLSRAMTEKMFSPVRQNYGYGWDVVHTDTLEAVFHTGYIPGYLSRLDRYPRSDITLILLTNYEAAWSPVDSWEISRLIFKELNLKQP